MPLAIDPHQPGWLARWLRRVVVEAAHMLSPAESQRALDAWLDAEPASASVGERALLAWLGHAAIRVGAMPSADGHGRDGDLSRRQIALQFAVALAWHAGSAGAARKLLAALERHRRGVADGRVGARDLAGGLDELGRALVARVADGVDGWLCAGTLAVLADIDARALVTLHAEAGQVAPRRDAIDRALANLHYERGAVLEAIVGLVRADAVVDGRERRLVNAALRAAQQGSGGDRVMRDMLGRGGEDLDGIAAALPTARERVRLLVLLSLAALADGEVDERERAWIDAVAAALGASTDERLEAHARVLAHAEEAAEMTSALGKSSLADAASRQAERRIRAIVRAHLAAIAREVQETGDLMVLLLASASRPLSDEEHQRMRTQLLDLCRAVPALAIFAAPGGAILLPILARVLPFSLKPSSFGDESL